MPVEDDRGIPTQGRTIFPAQVRHALFIEQQGRCRYCGRRMSSRSLEIDHKWPVSRNGDNERANLQLLCTACNLRKGIQTDEEFRLRYWRLLPRDGAIPESPIPQAAFSVETRRTRTSRAVRGIYRDRFERARRRETAGAPSEGDSGFAVGVLTSALIVITLIVVVAGQCGG